MSSTEDRSSHASGMAVQQAPGLWRTHRGGFRSRERRLESCRGTGRDINSNALTILMQRGHEPMTCADAEAFPIMRPNHARPTSRPAAKVLLSGIH